MTYFTSDQHFGHFNIIRLSHRPFASADEMDEAMIAKWNTKVKSADTIYVLGDLFFRSANLEPILKRLNGRKHLVLGNHDHSWTGKVRLGDYFTSVQTMKKITQVDCPPWGAVGSCGVMVKLTHENISHSRCVDLRLGLSPWRRRP